MLHGSKFSGVGIFMTRKRENSSWAERDGGGAQSFGHRRVRLAQIVLSNHAVFGERRNSPALIAVDIHSAACSARAERFRRGCDPCGFRRRARRCRSANLPACRHGNGGRRRLFTRSVCPDRFGGLCRWGDRWTGCECRDLIKRVALVAGGIRPAIFAARTHLGVHGSGENCSE